jgi:F-type H+-transporting ATPase subunit delta
MTGLGLARQYAHALYDVAIRQQALDRVSRELSEFASLVTGHDDLRRTLASPMVPPSNKRAIVAALADATGVSGEIRRLLDLVAERNRFELLPEIASQFVDRLNEAGRRVPAEVITAVPLDEARAARVAAALGRVLGRDVTVTTRVDPAIVGGLVARVGSVVFDGSVTRQVERLRERLRRDA